MVSAADFFKDTTTREVDGVGLDRVNAIVCDVTDVPQQASSTRRV